MLGLLRVVIIGLFVVCTCQEVYAQVLADPDRLLEAENRAFEKREQIEALRAFEMQRLRLEHQKKQKRTAFIHAPNAMKLMRVILENPGMIERLELLDSQREVVEKKFEELRELEKIVGEGEKDEVLKARAKGRKILGELADTVLIDTQMEQIGECTLGTKPLLAILTDDTLVGAHVDLSDKQKEKLLEECHKLGSEFREYVTKSKKRAAAIYDRVLTTEQKRNLFSVYQGRLIDERQKYSTPIQFFWGLTYGADPKDRDMGTPIDSWSEMEKRVKVR